MSATGIISSKKSTVTVSVSKERVDDRVGVTFRQQDSDQAIVVHRISASSLFAETDLRVGMTVQKINDVDARSSSLDLKQAMKLLREAEDVITIVAGKTDPVSSFDGVDEAETLLLVPKHGVEVAEVGDHEALPEITVIAVASQEDTVSSAPATAYSAEDRAPVAVPATAVSLVQAAASSSEETAPEEVNATAVVYATVIQGYSSHDESFASLPAPIATYQSLFATASCDATTPIRAKRAKRGSDTFAGDLVSLLESAFDFADV